MNSTLIGIPCKAFRDAFSLLSATRQSYPGANRHPLPIYDDGYGPVFIHRDSVGISGIVRAATWEDAYEICEDEFFPAGDEDAAEEYEAIEAMPDGPEKNHAQACFDESFGYRNNSRKEEDGTLSSVYAKDLNGDWLDSLTPSLAKELGITLTWEARG